MPVSIPAMLKADAKRHLANWDRSSGIGAYIRLIGLCPGFQLVICLRIQHLLGRVPGIGFFLRRVMWYFTTMWFGCDIDPHATFGPGIYFPHPTGIVIGGEWDVGANVSILQGVTLGRNNQEPAQRPQIGDGVLITAGAKVIGYVNVGRGATIGANAVVLKHVPDGFIAVGVPAKLIDPSTKARVAEKAPHLLGMHQ